MYDHAKRRRAQRRQRMRGCYVYVPAEELVKAGIDPNGPAPFYKVWGSKGGSAFVRFYKEA